MNRFILLLAASTALVPSRASALDHLDAVPEAPPVSLQFNTRGDGSLFCPFAIIAADGKVTVDRACLDRAADRCKPGAPCDQWDAVARLLRAAIAGQAELK